MSQSDLQHEIKKMKFETMYRTWRAGRVNQVEAARALGLSERSFQRYVARYETQGASGLRDLRCGRKMPHAASAEEAEALVLLYTTCYPGWNVKHFYRPYCRQHGGIRSYSWVQKTLRGSGVRPAVSMAGEHRQRREPMPLPGMILHQDGSTHEWVPGQRWDLIDTMDDSTREHYSMIFVPQESTASTFRAILEVIEAKGLFQALYSDRGSHYWFTPKEGGPVDKEHLTQVGKALQKLGIRMIAAYSPQARGRSERAFGTHQGRLPQELAKAGITTMEEANRYLREVYMPEFNEQFCVAAREKGTAFMPWTGTDLSEILCEHHPRTVGMDNCVSFKNRVLQIQPNSKRSHYMRAAVDLRRYPDGHLAIFYGPDRLGVYPAQEKTNEHRSPAYVSSATAFMAGRGNPGFQNPTSAEL